MPKSLQLNIAEPCHENWQNMTTQEQGRFCGSCRKSVVDFTMMSDQEVLNYLKAENAYLETLMGGTKDLREKLYMEMKSRIKEKDESVPSLDNGYYYYSRTEEGKQYFKFCRKKGSLDAPEEVLLDVDEMAKGHNYYGAAG